MKRRVTLTKPPKNAVKYLAANVGASIDHIHLSCQNSRLVVKLTTNHTSRLVYGKLAFGLRITLIREREKQCDD